MPRVEVKQRRHDIQSERCADTDDQVAEGGRREQIFDVFPAGDGVRDGVVDDPAGAIDLLKRA